MSQSTRLIDRQTDTFLATRLPCIQCSTVQINQTEPRMTWNRGSQHTV